MIANKVIIDTDPGVDDALAIAFAIKSEIPVVALSTVYGNSTVENSSKNALSLLQLMDKDIDIYQGEKSPLSGIRHFANSHGENGLGGFSLQTKKTIKQQNAIDFYSEILERHPRNTVTIIAIGPTTNLGKLIQKNKSLLFKAKQIIIMGGVFDQKGNVTPHAEFNVYNDPLALKELLRLDHPNIVIVPANICRKVTFDKSIFREISDEKLSNGLKQISDIYIDYYSNKSEYGVFNGGVMYDLLAVCFYLDKSSFSTVNARVDVEITSGEKYGETRIIKGKPNCKIVTDVNEKRISGLFVEAMNHQL